jgi:hypothetical protein
MKRPIIYFIAGMMLFCCPPNGLAILSLDDHISSEAPWDAVESSDVRLKGQPLPDLQEVSNLSGYEEELSMCSDAKLGVQFLCNPDWKIETETNVLLIIIAEEPSITMTITKEEFALESLDDLTMPVLKEIGSYADGLQVSRTMLNDRAVIEVKGVSKKMPDLQLHDYYLIERSHLYGVLFSAPSQEALASYEPLIQKIIGSFSFLPSTSSH